MSNQKAFSLLEALFAQFFCLYFLYVLVTIFEFFFNSSSRYFDILKQSLS